MKLGMMLCNFSHILFMHVQLGAETPVKIKRKYKLCKKKVYILTLLVNRNIYREASLGRLSGYLPAPGPTSELTFVIVNNTLPYLNKTFL